MLAPFLARFPVSGVSQLGSLFSTSSSSPSSSFSSCASAALPRGRGRHGLSLCCVSCCPRKDRPLRSVSPGPAVIDLDRDRVYYSPLRLPSHAVLPCSSNFDIHTIHLRSLVLNPSVLYFCVCWM
ncbi:hypothetical protein VTO42DRAFT_7809 [Malbranchea cinnamomea]